MQYSLLFQENSGYANEPHCYVKTYIAGLVMRNNISKLNTNMFPT
jgi:hypothetical protein